MKFLLVPQRVQLPRVERGSDAACPIPSRRSNWTRNTASRTPDKYPDTRGGGVRGDDLESD